MRRPYKDGELELILSLVPTTENVQRLAATLDRTQGAIKLIYRIAYVKGKFAQKERVQVDKIIAAKKKLGIVVGPQRAQP